MKLFFTMACLLSLTVIATGQSIFANNASANTFSLKNAAIFTDQQEPETKMN